MSKEFQKMYICSKCDAQSLKWSGRCLECGAWGALSESVINLNKKRKENNEIVADVLSLVDVKDQSYKRIETGISELDRVLGGGVVPGSLILLSGEPGIGKSTILAQISDLVSKNFLRKKSGERVVYVSGEESAHQVKGRMVRLNCNINNFDFISETEVEKVIAAIKKMKVGFVIVDSIQTVYCVESSSEVGSVGQIRACTVRFMELAKENDIAVILVGHVTKDGVIAGPKTLEHMVDTVIYLEMEARGVYQMLRATKNRFGSVNELGIFEMTSAGFKEVLNASSVFVQKNNPEIPGTVLSCVIEGSRPFLVEVQALVTRTSFGHPQRKSSGFDLNRLQVLIAVLSKRLGVNLADQDIVLNVVGGVRIDDPALDLAVCIAICSSFFDFKIGKGVVVFGEVGLGGELRVVSRMNDRLQEIGKLGFSELVIPECELKKKEIEISKCCELKDVVNFLRNRE